MRILKKLSEKLKNDIKSFVVQAILELQIKIIFYMSCTITQKPLGLLTF